jgi:hypothetical protein
MSSGTRLGTADLIPTVLGPDKDRQLGKIDEALGLDDRKTFLTSPNSSGSPQEAPLRERWILGDCWPLDSKVGL